MSQPSMTSQSKLLALATRFLSLGAAQRRVFLGKLREQGLDASALPIPSGVAGERSPTSFSQQRLWFLEQLEPGNSTYHLPGALRLKGALDVAALQLAFERVAERHASLRTVFDSAEDGAPEQVIQPSQPVPFEQLAAGDETELQGLADAFARRPFDLARGPLWRVALVRLAEDEHVLLVCLHHIIADGWSIQVLLLDVVQAYRASLEGDRSVLPSLPLTYADVALWQRACLQAGEADRQLEYWKQQLGDEPPVLELPVDRPRPARQSFRGARLPFSFDAALSGRMRELAQQRGVTLFTVMLAAYQVLLQRLSGQNDLRIGVPIAGRQRAETEGLIGFFVNTQILRGEVHADASFNQIIDNVRLASQGAQANQDLPFEQLVDALAPERSLSHNPLFQVLYNHQQRQDEALHLMPGLNATLMPLDSGSAQFDLALHTWENAAGELAGNWNYATDLFDASSVERLHARFVQLFAQMLERPDAAVGDVELLDSQDRAQLTQVNDTARDWAGSFADGHEPVVHRHFEHLAQLHPEREALRCGDQVLTYRQLDQRANQLAHYLRAQGVERETLVGVAALRSVEMVVALYAVLKAGGAYVPLDPEYPADRLRYMLEDAGVGLLLSHDPVIDDLPVVEGLQVLNLDRLHLAGQAITAPKVEIHPEQLAYMIYTSGSTGKPKGAGNTHAALFNRLAWMQEAYGLDATDAVLQKTPFSFDVSVWEFFWPLMVGARLVMAQPGDHRDPALLAALIEQQHITTLHFVPSMLAAFMAQDDLSGCASLKRIVCSGEALPADLARDTLQRLPNAGLFNLYGPTEAAIDVTHWTCRIEPGASVPIGRPIANLQIHILDSRLNPQPFGVPGELYIGGAGLARGYHQRPGLTAERFVASPFGKGERLYRTGDLARWRADGAVEYLGRLDHQIKLRGLRVEIGEIESALLDHPAVSEAVVVARHLATGQQLVGYLVADAFDEDQLRSQLKQRLPDYMVPAHLVRLDKFPLSANGKLDRKALPEPQLQQRAFQAPLAGVESQLAELWQDLLGVQQVGRQDNFFALGGDSILSLQIISRARKRGVQLSPRQMFERQTIAELAQVAQVLERDAEAVQARVEFNRDIPLTPIQHGFFEQPMRRRSHWNQSLLLTPSEALDAPTLAQALRALTNRHDALRMAFVQQDNGHWQQRYRAEDSDQGLLWQREVSLEQLPAACDAAQASLDLQNGPLLRAVHFKLAEGGERLLLVIHHLVVDGVSWRILLEDLHNAYTQAQAELDIDLGEKGLSFQRWANRLVEWAYSDAVLAEAAYWRNLPAAPRLPCANPNGNSLQGAVQQLHLQLDSARSQALLNQAPAAYRTQINDLLLTALTRAIGRWSGLPGALIALEGHGREDLFEGLDPSRTVGWFTSLYPVSLQAHDSLDSALKHTKETLRAVPHGGLGYGLLRHLRGQALPSLEGCVLFNYMGRLQHSSGLFALAEEGSGAQRAADAPLACELSIDAQVRDGQFSLTCSYSGERHQAASVQRLLDAYAIALDEVIEHCRSHWALTPSDFPTLQLTQAQLDALPIAARDVEQLYPLTPMQQGLLFHSELGQTADAGDAPDLYINQVALDIDHLPLARFTSAWAAAVQRHPILRTSFVRLTGSQQPVQLIRRDAALMVRELDLRNSDQALADVLAAERETPFNLHQAPLMRVLLVRRSETLWKLVWTFHHILLDGWSSAAVLGEVIQAAMSGTEPMAAGHYGDYVEWLLSRDAECSAQFWKTHLAGFEQPTLMAAALTPPSSPTGEQLPTQVQVKSMDLDSELLSSAARRQRVTANTLIQAVWVLLLQRYTGQQRVAFGATVSGRSAQVPGIERMLGLFINTLPLVQAPDAQQKVGDWLNRLQAHNLELREHEHTPLFEAQRYAGHAGRDLFDSLLVFENYPVDAVLRDKQPGGIQLGSVELSDKTHYPLSLAVVAGEQAHIHVNYHSNVFSAEQIEQLCGHFQTLLDGVCRFPDACIGDLSMLTKRDVEQMHAWNTPPFAPYVDRPIHELIADHARLRPDAIALVHGEQRLTFAEFDRRANQLAHALRARGIGTEVRVAIAMERGVDLWLAFFAVLKAGGAYIPLDPDYPTERLRYMLEDGGVKLLICHDAALGRVPVGEVPLLNLDHLDVSSEPETAPDVTIHPQQLAYLIYTSGSTGKPKGAAIAHRDISMHIQTIGERYGFTPEDRKFHFLSISFDGAHEGWMMPMCYGARVVLRDQEMWSVEQTYDTLIREGITVASFPPSYLRQLSDWAGLQGKGPGVKTYCFAGEAFSREMLHDVIRNLQPLWIINGYGPTETVVTPTLWLASSETADFTTAYAPIGDLVGDRQGYVMDADLNPLPQGIAGELYLGGAVARGYLDRPGATAERFLPHPFRPGERIYRSGDRVRLNSQGLLEYLGRIDHQIKIRGFRIEAGEIEAALKACEGVREALVIVRDSPSGKRLLGYVGGSDLSEDALKQQLGSTLPEYMVPAHIVVLQRLPQLPNGKLDRNALPDPQVGTHRFEAPKGERELQLAKVWQQLLGIESVSRQDSFFALGGDSIQSLAVITRLRQAGLKLLPKDVFSHPRLQDLALRLSAVEASVAVPDDEKPLGDVPLTPIQAHFFEQPMINRNHFNQALLLEVKRPIEAPVLGRALEAVLHHHDGLNLGFRQRDDGGWQQAYRQTAATDSLWLRNVADDAALTALCEQAQRSLDLENGPLLRLVLAQMPEGQRLLLVAHHLVVDGVSWRVLLEDVARAYTQLASDSVVNLGPKASSYQRWSQHLLQAAQRPEREAEVEQWLALIGQNETLWPVDDAQGRATEQDLEQCELLLDADSTRRLLREAPAALDARIDEILLAALAQALTAWNGQRDNLVALEGHGREALSEALDVGRTMGWFTSLFPVRVQAVGTLRQTLQKVRTLLRGLPDKGVGFGLLRYLGSDQVRRRLAELPTPQVVFNYLGQFDQDLGDGRFTPSKVAAGALIEPTTPLNRELEINGQVFAGQLGLTFRFSGQRYRRQTIERLQTAYHAALVELLDSLPVPDNVPAQTPPVVRHGTPNPLIRLSSGASDRQPVFCVHPVSGTVVGYYALARRLSAQWDVWGIQNRQVLDGNWRDTSIEQMARDYVKALLEQQPGGTYRLIGWSMGGTMVLEMARLLTRLGKRVEFVGLIDGYVPGAGQPRPAVPQAQRQSLAESDGDEHWQQLLGVERHMRQLANQCRELPPLSVPVYAWWAERSPENNDNAPALLEQGMGGRLQVSAWIDADHLSIVRDQQFITQLAESLAQVNERPQSHDFQEHEYA